MTLNIISWICYIGGTAVVLAGYIGLVSPSVSWIGWIVGMVGWGLSFFTRKQQSTAQELERLAKLKADGTLSEEEFNHAKSNLLNK